MSAKIYIEGGGDSKELHTRCREGFRKLLEKCGYSGRMPKLVACGGRGQAYDDFKTAHANSRPTEYIALLVDSEEPMMDTEKAWQHLQDRDKWKRPNGANDDQVLLMTTCMETWIICDRNALEGHYHGKLQESSLPALTNLEERSRGSVQDASVHATRQCSNAYSKGKRSFEILEKLAPATLSEHLASFRRAKRILDKNLK